MPNAEFLDEKVRFSLDKVVAEYRRNERYILTEQDLVMHSYEELNKTKFSGFEVRAGLMPYRKESDDRRYIDVEREHVGWHSEFGHRGAVFDLCIVSDDEKYWEEAKGVHPHTKYWRFPSYPYEAIAVAIELKARVHGNLRRVKSDVRKVSFLSRETKGTGFLVALDRSAKEQDVQEIDEAVKKEAREPGSRIEILCYPRFVH